MEINERLKELDLFERSRGTTLAKVLSPYVSESTVRTALTANHNPSFDFSKAVFTVYPNLNSMWYFFGKGSMFSVETSTSLVSETDVPYQIENWNDIRFLITTLKDLKKKVDHMIIQIDNLKNGKP